MEAVKLIYAPIPSSSILKIIHSTIDCPLESLVHKIKELCHITTGVGIVYIFISTMLSLSL